MSIAATNRVWSLRLGDAKRKLVLLKFADHAHEDGCNTWAKPETVAHFAECSKRTAQRITSWLIQEGHLREGDQFQYRPPKGRKVDPRYQPIVYDIAMTEEIRLAWKAASALGIGRRAVHVRGGGVRYEGTTDEASGDESEGELRGDDVTPLRDDSLSPLEHDASEDAEVSRHDNLTRLDEPDAADVTTAAAVEVPIASRQRRTNEVTIEVKNPPPPAAMESEIDAGQLLLVVDAPDPRPVPTFDDFWELYPRKEGKKPAAAKWEKAIITTEPAVVMEGLRRFVAHPRSKAWKYLPHPATWLHNARWEDVLPEFGDQGGRYDGEHWAFEQDAPPDPPIDLDAVFGPASNQRSALG